MIELSILRAQLNVIQVGHYCVYDPSSRDDDQIRIHRVESILE